jgi:nitrite reductase/ring-hydroxylating ferredoxin subunit
MVKPVVAAVAEVRPGTINIATLKGREIGLFNLDGAYFALLNRCSHAGASSRGRQIIGRTASDEPGTYRIDKPRQMIRRPWHGREFDTGQSCVDPARGWAPHFDVACETGGEIIRGAYAETFTVTVENAYLAVDL